MNAPGHGSGDRPTAPPAAASAAAPVLLDVLRFPLRGSRLIEASAGTGKTFTIAALYLRLVLGHGTAGGDHRPAGHDSGAAGADTDPAGVGSAGADATPATAYLRPLVPPEILVVTFTDAATQELRDRIRARLAEAAEAFSVPPERVPPHLPGEDLLADLRADHPPAAWPGCAQRLRLAAEWMDEAAVSTIHGWAQRMLAEHAFASGSLFTQTLQADPRALLDEAVRDYWRSVVVPLPEADALRLARWWPSPDALAAALRPVLPLADDLAAQEAQAAAGPDGGPKGDATRLPPPAPTAAQALQRAREATAQVLAGLKAPWGPWLDSLQAGLDEAVRAKQVDGRKLQARHYQPWLDALRAWAHGEDERPALADTSTAWTRLSPAGLAEAFKQPTPLLDHPALAALATLREALGALPDAHDDVLRHAVAWVSQRLQAEQAQRAEMGFDGLLTQLDRALQGPQGPVLAATIRRQFPVALIDEFQDTDPVQYRLFDAVYRVAEHRQDTALVLIGDPKQAIYAFRGADIHTYLAARRATGGRLATLGTNFRSTQAMVGAVNRLFGQAEARPVGGGAFLFRDDAAAPVDNPVPFHPVAARGRRQRWQVQGRAAPALTFWLAGGPRADAPADGAALPPAAHGPSEGQAPDGPPGLDASGPLGLDTSGPLGLEAYRQAMAQACAHEVARLLALGAAGQAGFAPVAAAPADPGPDALAPLRPGDIAVLVNSGAEAALVRAALAARGVRSVYLSDRESVWASPVASDLQRWLQAAAEPDDEPLLRAALATATLALDWPALDALNHDESAWEQRVLQFRGYHRQWQRQGVLPMLRRLMHDFGVPGRLLAADRRQAGAQGERRLTDLMHLAELLQLAQAAQPSPAALLRWLAQQRRDAASGMLAGGDDARKLRLESDADRVQVVTVHKSKGLEYPLVFLPFAAACRPVKPEDTPLRWHGADGRRRVALCAPDAAALAAADHERLGEDLRKLYVALTRACHANWVGVAPLKELHRSALAHLLLGSGDTPVAPAALAQALHALAAAEPGVAVRPVAAAQDAAQGPAQDSVGAAAAVARADTAAAPGLAEPARHGQPGWAAEPPLPARRRERWWMASYTALCAALQPMVSPLPTPAVGGPSEAELGPAFAPAPAWPQTGPQTWPQTEPQTEPQTGPPGAPPTAPSIDPTADASTEPLVDPLVDTAPTAAEARYDEAWRAEQGQPWRPERVGLPTPAWAAGPPEAGTLHGFARGAEAGSFLHGLLEWAGRQGYGRALADAAGRDALVERRCALPPWQPWAPLLRGWLAEWLATPLDLSRLTPGAAAVAPAQWRRTQVEMEFWLAVERVDVAALDALVCRHTLGGAPRPRLQPQQMHGLLKGFIDLVFEHQGRWYVADHKSNWLGPDDAAYHPQALAQAVLQHRYELQYVLYLTALHRLLRHRLPGYDYDRHVGGAVYLFLRGHRAPGQGLHLERPPRALVEALDRLLDGGAP